jgi:hypothetical protein
LVIPRRFGFRIKSQNFPCDKTEVKGRDERWAFNELGTGFQGGGPPTADGGWIKIAITSGNVGWLRLCMDTQLKMIIMS